MPKVQSTKHPENPEQIISEENWKYMQKDGSAKNFRIVDANEHTPSDKPKKPAELADKK